MSSQPFPVAPLTKLLKKTTPVSALHWRQAQAFVITLHLRLTALELGAI